MLRRTPLRPGTSRLKRTPLRPRAEPLSAGKPLRSAKGGTGLRQSRLRAVNPERRARLLERQFGPPERRAFVAALPCATCGKRASKYQRSHNSHVRKTRGAGGGPDDVAPMCWRCHRALENEGIATFCARRNSTPEHLCRLADLTAAAWLAAEAARVEGPP